MRILRWFLAAVLVMAALFGAAAAYLYFTFDPNDHRDRIVRIVKEKTGRSLQLDAPMSLSFFPRLGVRLEKASLDNPEGFGKKPFATADELELRVRVLPLIEGLLVVDTLVLDGVTIRLQRLADGRDNWSDLVKDGESGDDGKSQAAGGERWLRGYAVQGVRLTNAAIEWRDEAKGAHYRLQDVMVQTGSIRPGVPVPVEAGLRLEGLGEGMAVRARLKGTLGMTGNLDTLTIPDLVADLGFRGGALPPEGADAQLAASVSFEQQSRQLTLDDLAVKGAGGLLLTGHLAGSIAETPAFDGALVVQSFSPRRVMDALGILAPVTADRGVLEAAEASIGLKGDAKRLVLEPVALRFDDTSVKGRSEITLVPSFAANVSLDVDSIDLDRYLPPAEDVPAAGAAKQDAQTRPGSSPLGGLAALDMSASLSIGTLKVAGLTMNGTRVKVVTGGGSIEVDPLDASLYGGSYTGNLTLQPKGGNVLWRAEERLDGVNIGPLLTDVAGDSPLEGTGRLQARLNGAGLGDADVRRTAAGIVNFELRDGVLKGINLAQVYRQVKAAIRGQRVDDQGPDTTDFTVLSGSLEIGGGMARNDDLVMKTPFLRVTGAGKANLVSEALDYELVAKVVGTAKGQGGGDYADLEGIPVGVKVGGSFSKPVFRPDLESAARAVAQARLDTEREKLEQKARDNLGSEFEKALKSLF